jgi:hypothetical protein
MTKNTYCKKHGESYCFAFEDTIAWLVGWTEGCIVACCVTCYVEEIVDSGIAEEMVMGIVEGYEDVTYVERKVGGRAK